MRKPFLLLAMLVITVALRAQNTGYQLPPKDIAGLLLAKPTPLISRDHKGEWMLVIGRNSYPSVEELAQPEQRIAGLRFNPNNFSPSRQNFISDLSLKNLRTGKEYKIQGLPTPLMAGNISWNPGETKIAFTNTTNRQVDLYLIDISTQHASKVNTTPLNTILGIAGQWIDDKTVLYATRIQPASAAPPKRLVPDGPAIQENLGKSAPSATFEDLIKTPYDEALFAFYSQTQLMKNTADVETALGKPGIFIAISPSPDKRYLLLRILHKPFSYLVPAEGFNATVSIVDVTGKPVKTVTELPSSEASPRGFDNVQDIPRDYGWRNDQPATLIWCTPLDSGKIRKKQDYHDAVYALSAPFTGEPAALFQTKQRFRRIIWGNDSTAL